jgi:ribokinase
VAEIVVLGSLHLDIMVSAPGRPRQGETVAGTAWGQKCGGKGGNQAVAAARHGARTAMAGAVGDDDFGARLLANLQAAGVDTAGVATVPGGSGMSVAIVDPGGDYGAIIVSGANLTLGEGSMTPEMLAGAHALVLQNEVPDAANIAAARLAREAGVRTILNAAPARAWAAGLDGLVDILVVNAIEAEGFGAAPVASLADAAIAAERLLATADSVIVTAGGAGLAVASRDGRRAALPGHPIRLVSTHGAGDALIGALAARLAAGDTLADAARYANAAAAVLVATAEEARAALTPADARALLG